MPGTKRKGKGDAWYFEVTIGTDFSGKPVRYNRTFHGTEKQAEKALARFYTECEDGRARKESSATVSQMCGEVIDSLALTLKKAPLKVITPAKQGLIRLSETKRLQSSLLRIYRDGLTAWLKAVYPQKRSVILIHFYKCVTKHICNGTLYRPARAII